MTKRWAWFWALIVITLTLAYFWWIASAHADYTEAPYLYFCMLHDHGKPLVVPCAVELYTWPRIMGLYGWACH